ncbi:MAG: peptide-methionine (S)-S-oxide reductase MsrA [Burkholderiales bacterium]|jgi:peptide-methionine (S)-S-oxide reductase|nr:peptide-methionine (S)-S-oxide reductase MsrA [Burkholderiales bacterium]
MENPTPDRIEEATLGGGCFWCIEAVFNRLKGVILAESGYSGGANPNPSYEQVCSGRSGHVEVVRIRFRPDEIPFSEILDIFFTLHDPTTLNRQGNDSGTQYRSVIFYHDEQQKQQAQQVLENIQPHFRNPVVTALEPLKNYYAAEKYHQGYFDQNPDQPYCMFVVAPKVEKAEKVFKDQLKV